MTPSEFRAARKRLGLTVPEMAAALGKSPRMVNHYGSEAHDVPLSVELAIEALERRAKDSPCASR